MQGSPIMAHTPTYAPSFTERALAPLRYPAKVPAPANMNGAPVIADDLLEDTLRHFAEFGLAAASKALERSENAFAAGNETESQHWLEIGRALDRRKALQFERDRLPSEL